MAGLTKFDPRLESLVIEQHTHWDPEIGDLAAEDRHWLAEALHRDPQLAGKIEYVRAHTGFERHITVTVADIERLYEERVGG